MSDGLVPVKGLLVFNIDVGALPPEKALVHVEKMKSMLLDGLASAGKKLPDDVGVAYLPIRPNEVTCFEYLGFGEPPMDSFGVNEERWSPPEEFVRPVTAEVKVPDPWATESLHHSGEKFHGKFQEASACKCKQPRVHWDSAAEEFCANKQSTPVEPSWLDEMRKMEGIEIEIEE